ncbi:two-component regulator propeller domain-containing protein [Dysgonomonas sp. Marseille-P4677]|uniref:hybrid sensor histidine kinase/response regulator transcription factor n=1 Tax=Dysgonomonas sp. Marseille-P4677 TaxID=2364790 RepID=UPI001F1E1C49|nr:two-component regulator propeller domain-containing protein [Dysgonomonas sp. Marseille-P4677]
MSYQSFNNINLSAEADVINCFVQDTQGLIWIGSNKGLFSYDGYSSQPHFSLKSKANAQIYCILVVGDSHLYLGTDNGVLFFNYKTDRYETLEIEFPSDVRTMAVKDNTLWIGTLNGLHKYNLETRVLENVSQKGNLGLPHKTIYSIIDTEENNLYIGTYDGLCKYIPKTDNFEAVHLPADSKRSNLFVNSLLEDSFNQCVWIGTEGALFKYSPSKKLVEEINSFKDNSIKSLAIDQNKNLLVGTDNGLYIYNVYTSEVQHIVHDSRNEKSLTNNIIWDIFVDKDNNAWFGTNYGISLSRYNKTFRIVPISEITGVGDGNHFRTIYKDSKNNFWLGGTNGLILSPPLTDEPSGSIWYRMGDSKHPISHNRIRHIYEDKTHNLWIASDGSINRYDYNKKQFIHYNIIDSSHSLNSNWAYYIFEDDYNQLWIATCLGGIFVVDKQRLLNFTSGNYIADYNYSTRNGLSGDFVNQIVPDHNGNVWALLYNNGINKIDPKLKTVTKIPIETGTNSENPNYIICDKEGFIWVGFRSRLVQINPENNHCRFIEFNSFGNSEVLSLTEEGQNIWISASDGVWVLDKYTHNVRRPDITTKSYTSSYFDKTNNNIYLGGNDEFVLISPDILNESQNNSPIILTALYINNQLYKSEPKENSNSIRYLNSLNLSYKENSLSFEFSDLVYSKQESNKYVYRLEGLDNNWNIIEQTTNRISFTSLEYGEYQLIISKLDASGEPSNQTFTFPFSISPPWYYSIWAKCVYALLILGLIIWIINFYRVKNNLRIERIEKEKTLELSNLKIDFFTNVSHEFKTPLSLIIAPISRLLLEIKDPLKKKQLEAIQRNALKLNSLIRQVLDFNRTDSNTNDNLILSKIEFVQFTRSLFSIYEDGYKEKELTFIFDTNKEKIYINIDVLKIESVLNNLISNACKYTKEGGTIRLNLNLDEKNKHLNISISDTGVGIPPQDIPYVFERFYQSAKTARIKEGTGIGLYLAKTYTEQHGGTISISSEEDTGTEITIILPHIEENEIETNIPDNSTINGNENKARVLVVEDNPEIAEFISQTLSLKYDCNIAYNGKSGLDMAIRFKPNIIVSDIMMPIMDGLEMSKQIRKNIPTSTIPIILLTAKDDKNTELGSISLNVEAFIAKPFDTEILLSRIEQLLRNKQQIEDKLRIESITEPKAIEATSPDEKFLSEITRIIEEKVADPDLNVNALSSISGISSKQTYRKVKQLTGMSPVEYIRSIRIKKAAMLLSQNKFSISEVMYMVGFSNHSYFTKCFQAEFGKTPRQFTDDLNLIHN